MTELKVNISKTINAPIEDVYDAWLDPEMVSKFMLPMPGMENPEVSIDAREGGSFEIIMQVGDNKVPHTGKYTQMNRPENLVFTWESPASTDDSIVSLEFTKLDDARTHIELTHTRFIDEQHRSNHESGWCNILEMLDSSLNS